MNRRRFFAAALSLSALTLTGCPRKPPAPSAGASVAPTEKIKAGLVTDTAGVNDRSFNASAWEGLQRAQKELGAQIKYVESRRNADYVANLSQFAKARYDVVFAVGFLMQDAVTEVAFKYPNTKFVLIDGKAPDRSNCASYQFREEEGAFLVGALAGAMTKTNVIGFVGGMEMPLIEKFQYGYQAGAVTTNPNANVLVGYAGRFDDPQKGQEIALSQINSRADILFHAAGQTGLGVIKAVQNKGEGFYAIGVDKDQDDIAPGRVLTSMIKRVDHVVFEACQKVATNQFERGVIELGLKEKGIDVSEMKFTRAKIPADVLKKIEEIRQRITDGKLHPPKTRNQYTDFAKKETAPAS